MSSCRCEAFDSVQGWLIGRIREPHGTWPTQISCSHGEQSTIKANTRWALPYVRIVSLALLYFLSHGEVFHRLRSASPVTSGGGESVCVIITYTWVGIIHNLKELAISFKTCSKIMNMENWCSQKLRTFFVCFGYIYKRNKICLLHSEAGSMKSWLVLTSVVVFGCLCSLIENWRIMLPFKCTLLCDSALVILTSLVLCSADGYLSCRRKRNQ